MRTGQRAGPAALHPSPPARSKHVLWSHAEFCWRQDSSLLPSYNHSQTATSLSSESVDDLAEAVSNFGFEESSSTNSDVDLLGLARADPTFLDLQQSGEQFRESKIGASYLHPWLARQPPQFPGYWHAGGEDALGAYGTPPPLRLEEICPTVVQSPPRPWSEEFDRARFANSVLSGQGAILGDGTVQRYSSVVPVEAANKTPTVVTWGERYLSHINTTEVEKCPGTPTSLPIRNLGRKAGHSAAPAPVDVGQTAKTTRPTTTPDHDGPRAGTGERLYAPLLDMQRPTFRVGNGTGRFLQCPFDKLGLVLNNCQWKKYKLWRPVQKGTHFEEHKNAGHISSDDLETIQSLDGEQDGLPPRSRTNMDDVAMYFRRSMVLIAPELNAYESGLNPYLFEPCYSENREEYGAFRNALARFYERSRGESFGPNLEAHVSTTAEDTMAWDPSISSNTTAMAAAATGWAVSGTHNIHTPAPDPTSEESAFLSSDGESPLPSTSLGTQVVSHVDQESALSSLECMYADAKTVETSGFGPASLVLVDAIRKTHGMVRHARLPDLDRHGSTPLPLHRPASDREKGTRVNKQARLISRPSGRRNLSSKSLTERSAVSSSRMHYHPLGSVSHTTRSSNSSGLLTITDTPLTPMSQLSDSCPSRADNPAFRDPTFPGSQADFAGIPSISGARFQENEDTNSEPASVCITPASLDLQHWIESDGAVDEDNVPATENEETVRAGYI